MFIKRGEKPPAGKGAFKRTAFGYYDALMRLFFSKGVCTACGRGLNGAVCEDCLELMRTLPRCFFCASFTPVPCSVCAGKGGVFSRAAAALPYEGVLSESLKRYKFKGSLALARPLAGLLGETYKQFLKQLFADGEPDIIVPVPADGARRAARGFHHTAELARPLSLAVGRPYSSRVLTSLRPLPLMARQPPHTRPETVRGAFHADKTAVAGKKVLLVDDIISSGSTAGECARTLLNAGCAEVAVLAVASPRIIAGADSLNYHGGRQRAFKSY